MDEQQMTTPYIPIREVIPYCPNAVYWNTMSPELKRRYFMPYWTEERLRRHLAMLKAFGFNAVQVSAAPQMVVEAGVTEEEWHATLRTECLAARDLGMSVSQFVWGTVVFDPVKREYVSDLDWHDAGDRTRLGAYTDFQTFLATYVDRVITHWLDPGGPKHGCPKCSIDTVVEIHNVILDKFRSRNPAIQGFLSNWMMKSQGWPARWRGYEGVSDLARHPALDANSGIAIGLMNYGADGVNLDSAGRLSAADLHTIADAGRPAGVWGWYTTDIEILPALHVHTSLLQNYFRSLPPDTRDLLAWHSVDDNCHGLNMQNLYIAGKLMQDPRQDAQALLDEFVRGFVGETHASAVGRALRFVEQVRCRSRRYEYGITEGRHTVDLVWLAECLGAAGDVIRDLDEVTIPQYFQPAWPVTMSPAEYLEELRAHLAAIHDMLRFLDKAIAVQRMKAAGDAPETIAAAIEALPTVRHDPRHTAGLEPHIYHEMLTRLKAVEPEALR